ncbi:hypothetical protein NIES592_08085 [Fischerella major NIES-592]|uniref:Uncharacterized protein n=1 Tax=Fischerella major NIES-592 TaxID=210994 RepID=A0A1U7H1J0_9CYAN|nr:hypothetical protein [Fischerella major]OKH14826.1 hypothetical protein NIES592_08085 [Fischerella major NIES-592]
MKRIIGISLTATLLAINTQAGKANPGLAIPAAGFCSSGVGTVVCAVLGVITAGGVVYTIVNKNGEKHIVDSNGNVFMKKYEDFLEPGEVAEDRYKGKDATLANDVNQCRKIAEDRGREVAGIISRTSKNGTTYVICIFK